MRLISENLFMTPDEATGSKESWITVRTPVLPLLFLFSIKTSAVLNIWICDQSFRFARGQKLTKSIFPTTVLLCQVKMFGIKWRNLLWNMKNTQPRWMIKWIIFYYCTTPWQKETTNSLRLILTHNWFHANWRFLSSTRERTRLSTLNLWRKIANLYLIIWRTIWILKNLSIFFWVLYLWVESKENFFLLYFLHWKRTIKSQIRKRMQYLKVSGI